MKTVAVLVGSLGKASINLIFAKALQQLAESKLQFDFIELGDLPHYDNDLWDNPPASVTGLKARIEAADAVLIAMPEYNRSFPGVIKDALDWGTRPWGQNSWTGKPISIVGTTPGATGTAAGQGHLRAILPVYGMIVMAQPEIYFQTKPGLIDENFKVTEEQTRAFLASYIDAFAAFIDRHGARDTPAIAAE